MEASLLTHKKTLTGKLKDINDALQSVSFLLKKKVRQKEEYMQCLRERCASFLGGGLYYPVRYAFCII